jgi:hypothetical protein
MQHVKKPTKVGINIYETKLPTTSSQDAVSVIMKSTKMA